MNTAKNGGGDYYSQVDEGIHRRKMYDKLGYTLRRNRSPVNSKYKRHATTTTEIFGDVINEDHYAVPDTRSRNAVSFSKLRNLSGPPGPSSTLRTSPDSQTNLRLLSGDIRSGSRIPSGGIRNGHLSKNSSKHISFETLRNEPFPGQKQVTFQQESEPIIGTENFFVGRRIAGKAVDSKTPMIKSYWEANIQREEKLKETANNALPKKGFGFPKWRSNDALSASLVASKGNVEIPKDSKIPQHRLEKLEETERVAQQTMAIIRQSVETPKKLQKGKSLDSLMMQLDYQPWYDRNQIREGISRESIANLGATKDKFENCTLGKTNNRRPENTGPSERYDPSMQQIQLKYEPKYSGNFRQEKNNDQNTLERSGQRSEKQEQQEKRDKQHSENAYNTTDTYLRSTIREQDLAQSPNTQNQKNFDEAHVNLTTEQEIFLLFIKQNVDLVGGLGIVIPNGLKSIMNELPWRKVELRTVYDEEPKRPAAEIKSYQPQYYNKDYQNGLSSTNKGGRYVKNPSAVNGNGNHRIISRKTFEISPKNTPENRRPIMQEVDREKAGDSLIAAEIRMLRDREEELRRSRSELGLPNLEDTIEFWRNGYNNNRQMNPLRSAVSYDHLHQPPQQISKTVSSEHLHHISDESARSLYEMESKTLPNERELHHKEQRYQQSERQFQQNDDIDQNQKAQNRQTYRKSETDRPLQNGGEILVNRECIAQRNQLFQYPYSQNHYKLHKSDDPDVMIYGPSTRRQSSCADSTLHLVGSPVTNGQGMRTVRYE